MRSCLFSPWGAPACPAACGVRDRTVAEKNLIHSVPQWTHVCVCAALSRSRHGARGSERCRCGKVGTARRTCPPSAPYNAAPTTVPCIPSPRVRMCTRRRRRRRRRRRHPPHRHPLTISSKSIRFPRAACLDRPNHPRRGLPTAAVGSRASAANLTCRHHRHGARAKERRRSAAEALSGRLAHWSTLAQRGGGALALAFRQQRSHRAAEQRLRRRLALCGPPLGHGAARRSSRLCVRSMVRGSGCVSSGASQLCRALHPAALAAGGT